MKTPLPLFILFGSIILSILGCTAAQNKSSTPEKADSLEFQVTAQSTENQNNETSPPDSLIDSRDGEVYPIVTIGRQTWMAANLRYYTPNSWVNSNYPSTIYGRLYDQATSLTVCPKGWHLPSDSEWNQLEMTLGMSPNDMDKTGWRGTHSSAMKSEIGWNTNETGTNSSGFNAFPAGYYFQEDSTGGLGSSSGFWTAPEMFSNDKGVWIRFIGGPPKGVNRMYAEEESRLNDKLACRCIKD